MRYTGGPNNTFNRLIELAAGNATIDQIGAGPLFSLGVVSGSGTLTKTGSAALILQANNTYSGQTNINAGTLQVRDVNALGAVAGKTVVAGGAVLSAGGGLTGTINEPIDLNGNGDGNGALQAVDAGTDVTFAGPVNLLSNASVGGTSHLAISGNITGAGGLTKYGSNRVDLSGANTYAGRTAVASGILDLAPAAQYAVFSLGGADVQAGKLAFDYSGAASPATVIQSLLISSYHGGLWDIGQLRSSTVAATGLTLGWVDDGFSKVTVMATYAGDFNVDGVVDGLDLNLWKANFGAGAAWPMGDANYDGAVNGLDLDLVKANFGLPPISGGSSVVGVPEPGASRSWLPD